MPAGAVDSATTFRLTARAVEDDGANGATAIALSTFALGQPATDGFHPLWTPFAVLGAGTPAAFELVAEPDGAAFDVPVELEIPATLFPLGEDEALVVLSEGSDGVVEVVSDVRLGAETVTVPLDHFSAVKLIRIPFNVFATWWTGIDKQAIDDASQLVGPHVLGVAGDVVAAHCRRDDAVLYDASRLPNYFDLLNNLGRASGDIGGIDFDQYNGLLQWLKDIRSTGAPSVSVAEIYERALELSGNDAFQALVLAHEVLRDDRENRDLIDRGHGRARRWDR